MTSRLFLAPLLLAAFAGPLLASGTISRPSIPRGAATSDSHERVRSHERGRAAYTRKISCSSCPVPGGARDAASAKQIVMRIDAREFDLSRGERRRVKAFLVHRFDL